MCIGRGHCKHLYYTHLSWQEWLCAKQLADLSLIILLCSISLSASWAAYLLDIMSWAAYTHFVSFTGLQAAIKILIWLLTLPVNSLHARHLSSESTAACDFQDRDAQDLGTKEREKGIKAVLAWQMHDHVEQWHHFDNYSAGHCLLPCLERLTSQTF